MIGTLKKRYKIGNVITIQTTETSYTGKIDAFEETCIVLETDNSIEIIANNAIVRFSAPRIINSESKAEAEDKTAIEEKTIETTESLGSLDTIEEKSVERQIELKPITEYKVGEIIPLEQLTKISGNKMRFAKVASKPKDKFNSFADLEQLIFTDLETENEKIVSANGVITNFFGDRNFGFIADKFGFNIWFGFKNIIDKELSNTLMGMQIKVKIPVVFTLSKNYKGDTAVLIQKPKTIQDIANIANTYFEDDKTDIALGLIEQILFAFPGNHLALKLKSRFAIERFRFSGFSSKPSYKSYDLNYQKATKAKNVDKNFEDALKYYLLAFQNNEKKESCIKDIAMLYVSMGELQKAVEFMTIHEKNLQDNITTYNYLVNFYSSVKEFQKVIENVDLLIEDRFVTKDRRKHSRYLAQKGFALIQLDHLESARDILEEAVSLHRENTYASRLLNALDEPDQAELSLAIAEAEFDSFGGGLGKFIADTLDKYDEYFGVPPKVIDTANFTWETLGAIRRLIDTAGKARPRERANYLLTEAKLMTFLEPEKESNLRSVLARHCNAMALNHISENSSMDVIRNYYLEAFSLEENYKHTAPQVALFLISYRSSYSELLSTKTPSIEEALKFIIDIDTRDNIWEGILSMFLWNRSISAQIIAKLFDNSNFREKSIIFLRTIGIKCKSQPTIDEYINLWNQTREKRQRDYSRWLASIKAIYTNDNIETLANQLYDSLNDARKNWLIQLDTSRLNTISTDIVDVLNQYLLQSGYRDKERYYGFAKAQVNQLILEIKEKPTKFSYEGFVPLLEKIDILLDKSFKTVEAASSPKVKIRILREASVVGNDNIVPFQVKVENSKDSSPIHDINIVVQDSSDVSFIKKNHEHFESVDGGEDCILKLAVKVSMRVITDKATSLNVIWSYKKRNQDEPVVINEELSLRLYSKEEFDIIANPYASIANSSGVTNKDMFYGRNEFIKDITDAIILAESKQVVIYGQKRSGKTAVLDYLKISLEETKQLFCIKFSVGDIFETISTKTFFFKILSLIGEELEFLKMDGGDVPIYRCPDFKEFDASLNPSDEFRRQIRLFKKTCQPLEQWRNKKLVVMIDEFTYLYTAIKEGKISDTFMKQWKAITQNENATFSAVLVGQDIFPAFKEDFPNEFGATQDERLTYLSEYYAEKLIEEPTWNNITNSSRLLENALAKILEYTSFNPYYIVQFCDRLITEMNRQRIPAATIVDIKDVADTFINGGQALTDDKFDNLLNAGEKHDIQRIPKEHSKAILRQIAINAKTIGFCLREQISIGKPEYEDEILKDLVKREVLEQKGDSYKIQVKLFQEWLLIH